MKEEAKTFFGKVIVALLGLFISNYKDFLLKLWKKVPELIKPEVVAIISIVNLIRGFVDGEGKNLIEYVIPGNPDEDENVLWLRNIVNKVLLDNNSQNKPGNELTRGELITIGSELLHEITGMPWGQSVITMQNGFDNVYGIAKEQKV